MKQLIRKLSKVAPSSSSSSYSLLRSDSLSSSSSRSLRQSKASKRTPLNRRRSSVPSGHVPVYVGEEEMERFVVSADLMNHPIFVKLLNKSAQEYGYEQKGALKIPCNVLLFERLLDALIYGRDVSSDVLVLDLINSLFNSSDDGFIF
ncbi:Auxin-responsive protein SAUR72 [Bienertia sinuspersici]